MAKKPFPTVEELRKRNQEAKAKALRLTEKGASIPAGTVSMKRPALTSPMREKGEGVPVFRRKEAEAKPSLKSTFISGATVKKAEGKPGESLMARTEAYRKASVQPPPRMSSGPVPRNVQKRNEQPPPRMSSGPVPRNVQKRNEQPVPNIPVTEYSKKVRYASNLAKSYVEERRRNIGMRGLGIRPLKYFGIYGGIRVPIQGDPYYIGKKK